MFPFHRSTMVHFGRLVAIGLVLICVTSPQAGAHEGPPFPILVDQPTPTHRVSVWADPDVGEAAFYVLVETPTGGQPSPELVVLMSVQPASGRLASTTYQAERQRLRSRTQFEINPYFDQRDLWNVQFQLQVRSSEPEVLSATVESTPPGLGGLDLVIYSFPFLMIGGLWVMALWRHRAAAVAAAKVAQPLVSPKDLIDAITPDA